MNFRDIAVGLVVDFRLRDICEVGVWRGELAERLYVLDQRRTLVLVDPWSALWNDFGGGSTERYTCTMGGDLLSQDELNRIHDGLVAAMPAALILRMPSVIAARHVPDRCLDFVFIDAVHTRHECAEDLAAWTCKIRPGGIIAGDDYCGPVEAAVDRHFSCMGRDVNRIDNVWWAQL